MRDFYSLFATDLDRMIDLKVSLGYSENSYLPTAKKFDAYCAEYFPASSVLTTTIVLAWLKPEFKQPSKVTHTQISFVRTLGKYQTAVGKAAYVLPDQFTAGKSTFLPYIFDDKELELFFRAVDTYTCSKDPFSPVLLSTYFRLTYTCGLRPAEGRLLKRNEVDLSSREICIVNSKYHKSRTVIMSDDMTRLARKYAVLRDIKFPDSPYFFPRPDGEPYTDSWIQGRFKLLFSQSKPEVPKDLLPAVRVYDLRHRFATEVLHRWIDEKKDIHSRLPYLRTYMGHKELSATEYYIHLLPERLVRSAGIDWEAMNKLIPRAELWQK